MTESQDIHVTDLERALPQGENFEYKTRGADSRVYSYEDRVGRIRIAKLYRYLRREKLEKYIEVTNRAAKTLGNGLNEQVEHNGDLWDIAYEVLPIDEKIADSPAGLIATSDLVAGTNLRDAYLDSHTSILDIEGKIIEVGSDFFRKSVNQVLHESCYSRRRNNRINHYLDDFLEVVGIEVDTWNIALKIADLESRKLLATITDLGGHISQIHYPPFETQRGDYTERIISSSMGPMVVIS